MFRAESADDTARGLAAVAVNRSPSSLSRQHRGPASTSGSGSSSMRQSPVHEGFRSSSPSPLVTRRGSNHSLSGLPLPTRLGGSSSGHATPSKPLVKAPLGAVFGMHRVETEPPHAANDGDDTASLDDAKVRSGDGRRSPMTTGLRRAALHCVIRPVTSPAPVVDPQQAGHAENRFKRLLKTFTPARWTHKTTPSSTDAPTASSSPTAPGTPIHPYAGRRARWMLAS